MTETEVTLGQLQQQVAHLAEMTEQGWVLKWGDAPEAVFEIVCRKANALQVQKLDALLSEGHRQALSLLR